jgi:hypothetical protein
MRLNSKGVKKVAKTSEYNDQIAFIMKAIDRLRTDRSRGIHSVYSGLNAAFRLKFGADPVAVTSQMARDGLIQLRPVRGGVMLYLSGEAPTGEESKARKVLAALED